MAITSNTGGIPPLFIGKNNPFVLYYRDYRAPDDENIFPLVVRLVSTIHLISAFLVLTPFYTRLIFYHLFLVFTPFYSLQLKPVIKHVLQHHRTVFCLVSETGVKPIVCATHQIVRNQFVIARK